MKKSFILIACAVTGFASAQNIVSNGDFSHSTYTHGGWDEISSSSAITSVYGWHSVGNDLAGIGVGYLGATNQEIDLSGGHDQGGTGIYQVLNTKANQTYKLSFDVYTGGGYGYPGGVDVSFAGQQYANLQGYAGSNASLDRKQYTYFFNATSATTTLDFMDNHGVVSHIGNVDCQAVPEPSTFFGLGLPFIAFAGRRLKKKA